MERTLIGEAAHSVPLVTPPQKIEPASPLDLTDFVMSTIGLSTATRGSPHRNSQFEYQLGNLSLARGEFEDAAASFRRVLACHPGFAEAHNNLGIALSKLGRPVDAVSHYRRAIAIAPGLAEAHNNLGCALILLGQLGAAIDCYKEAVSLAPAAPSAYTNLALALHYVPGVDNGLIAETTRRWAACIKRPPTPHRERRKQRPEGRLRIGYVSGDFRSHPVAYFIENVLAAHDRKAIEIFCYGTNAVADATTTRIAGLADRWRDIARLADAEAAQCIAGDAIDILVDLSGHTANNRLTLFACKPAPIQCTWLGYVGTTGLTEIDYVLADRFVIPPEDDGFYSEKPYRLPHSYLCFSPPAMAIDVGTLPALAAGGVTFGSFNNLLKLNRGVIETWSDILAAVPGSRLFLKTAQLDSPVVRDGIAGAFASRGIARERLVLAAAAPRQELLAAYNEVDIALDPFPYGGGTTTLEALWMGVPVVTLRGTRFVGRVGESILTTLGLPGLVADSLADYRAVAIDLAADLPRLAALRGALRQCLVVSPLCDANAFARELETAYRTMWRARRHHRTLAA